MINPGDRIIDKRSYWESRTEMLILGRPKEELSAYEKSVYSALCGFSSRAGEAFPSVKTLANFGSCSERQVYRVLNTLEQRGLIVRNKQTRPNGAQTSNLYEIYGFEHYVIPAVPAVPVGIDAGLSSTSTETREAHLSCSHPLSDQQAYQEQLHINIKNKETLTGGPMAPAPEQAFEKIGQKQHCQQESTAEQREKPETVKSLAVAEPVILNEHAQKPYDETQNHTNGSPLPDIGALNMQNANDYSENDALFTPDDVPEVMRECVDYFLLKTGRAGLRPEELSAVKALEIIHVPQRINREISKAIERFKEKCRSLMNLTFVYIYESLKFQNTRNTGASNAPPQPQVKDRYAGCYINAGSFV